MEEEIRKKQEAERIAKKWAMLDRMNLDTINREKRAERRALSRRLYQESSQAQYAKGFTKAQEAVEWRRKEVMQDVSLAQQILSDRIKEDQEMNQRRVLRGNQELQELESRIKQAYIKKELCTQLEAKRAEKIKHELERQEDIYRLNAVQDALKVHDEQRRIEEERKKREYREFLQEQMIDKHKQKVEQYKATLEDRAIMEDAIKAAEENDKKEEEHRLKKIEEVKQDIDEYYRSRQVWLMKEKEKEEDEERKIKEYLEEKFRKEKELQDEARKREEERLKLNAAVIKVMTESSSRRAEEDRINQILLDEDSRQKVEAKIKAEYDKKMRMRQELRDVFTKQIDEKLHAMEEERKYDMEYCEQMFKQIEENNRLDRELQQKKKLKNVQYAEELKQVIEDRDKVRQRDLYRRIGEYHASVKENQEKMKEIEEERICLLKEHSPQLLGFLPKGLLRQVDLPRLDPQVQAFYNYKK
ncbi:hypothetical protein O3M35_010764 [Rhynocoris fuscipes]|uniref:Meiosis-specific nuclear structural protein 1 n=1 Tax=Rhynocoris fuscipes TaxID=488301 RepID=A0AAW1D3X1_9HEMI